MVGKESGVMVFEGMLMLLLLLVGFGVCVGNNVVGFDEGYEEGVVFSIDGGVTLRVP